MKLTTKKITMLEDVSKYGLVAGELYHARDLNGQVIVQKQFGLWVPVEDGEWDNDGLEETLKANSHLTRMDLS